MRFICSWIVIAAAAAAVSDVSVAVCADHASPAAPLRVCAAGSPGVLATAHLTAPDPGAIAASGGWPVLRVATHAASGATSMQLWEAAGFAEGVATHGMMWELHQRLALIRKPAARDAIRSFASAQYARVLLELSNKPAAKMDEYDGAVRLVAAQVRGLTRGYNTAVIAAGLAPNDEFGIGKPDVAMHGTGGGPSSARFSEVEDRRLSEVDVLELNSDGDAFDIAQAYESGVASWPILPTGIRGSPVTPPVANHEAMQASAPAVALGSRGTSEGGDQARALRRAEDAPRLARFAAVQEALQPAEPATEREIASAAAAVAAPAPTTERAPPPNWRYNLDYLRSVMQSGKALPHSVPVPILGLLGTSWAEQERLRRQLREAEEDAAAAAVHAPQASEVEAASRELSEAVPAGTSALLETTAISSAAVPAQSEPVPAAVKAAVDPADVDEHSHATPAAPLGRLPRDTYDLDAWLPLAARGHCTAFVSAALSSGADAAASSRLSLWAAHTTWSDYAELVRLWKVYRMEMRVDDGEGPRMVGMAAAHRRLDAHRDPARFAHTTTSAGATSSSGEVLTYVASFSSYPGFVTSTDDWYQTSAGLTVTETTTAAVNAEALRLLTPNRGSPTWLRVAASNMVAGDAEQWAAAFARNNGGTYGCSWAVVDAVAVDAALKRARAGRVATAPDSLADLPNNALVVVEQSPMRVWSGDVTPVLRAQGLWVSANRPMSPEVRADLGYPATPPTAPAHPPAGDGAALPRLREVVEEAVEVVVRGTLHHRQHWERGAAVPTPAQFDAPAAIETVAQRDASLLLRFAPHDIAGAAGGLSRFSEVAAAGGAAAAAATAPLGDAMLAPLPAAIGGPHAARWADALRFVPSSRGGERLVTPAIAAHLPRFADASSAGGAGAAAGVAPFAPAAYFSHMDNPRGRILAAVARKTPLTSLEAAQHAIRRNGYHSEVEAQGRPYLTVAARYDLAAPGDTARAANGATDGKVASLDDMLALRSHIVLGPSTDAGALPPFDWRAWVDAPSMAVSDVAGFTGSQLCNEGAAAAGIGAGSTSSFADVAIPRMLGGVAAVTAELRGAASAGAHVYLPCRFEFAWGTVAA